VKNVKTENRIQKKKKALRVFSFDALKDMDDFLRREWREISYCLDSSVG
jgi:hypothetical protein